MLLNLREALDLPNLYYVIALSPEVVEEGLKRVHPGWDEPIKFLEKIIEYPAYLPSPSQDDIQRFVRHHAESVSDHLDLQAIDDIIGFLPRNPRKDKLFLRFLASLSGQFKRFSNDEISFRKLYLCQLLRLEFPNETRGISGNTEALENLQNFCLRRTFSSDRKEKEEGLPINPEFLPEETESQHRFIEICTAIGEFSFWHSEYTLPEMFNIVERPPLLTWREFLNFFDQVKQAESDKRAGIIEDRLKNVESRKYMLTNALFSKTIKLRDNIHNKALDSDTENEIIEALEGVKEVDEFLRILVEDLAVLKKGMISADTWTELYNHLYDASRFSEPKETYQWLRNCEFSVLRNSIEGISSELKEEILNTRFKVDKPTPALRCSEEFQQMTREIIADFSQVISEAIIERFSQPDGLESFGVKKVRQLGKISHSLQILISIGLRIETVSMKLPDKHIRMM